MAKTTTAKRLAEEKNITVREAERQLDTDVCLTECEWWVHFRLHCDFLLHRMFVHAMATGQKEHDCTICHSMQKPSPVWDLGAELSVVELVHTNSMREEIGKIYRDIHQLQWLPGKMPCDMEIEEHFCHQILDPIKSTSSISGIPHHWRNQDAPPASPGWI